MEVKVRPYGAYSFFMYSKQACCRASTECIGGRLRPLLCMDAVSAIMSAQGFEKVPHKILTRVSPSGRLSAKRMS